jgi:SAM-dependent methyltransferase
MPMKDFWDERYEDSAYVYGEIPNEYLQKQLNNLSPGKILFPCEGEGRNATFAAINGWEVFACDFSISGREKALALANKNGVSFEYQVCDILAYEAKAESFDVIALIFAHFPIEIRAKIHQKLVVFLKPGGTIIIEGFNKQQMNKNSAGPKSPEMLFDKDALQSDFQNCDIVELEEKNVLLKEGKFHQGEAEVIRGIFRKKN